MEVETLAEPEAQKLTDFPNASQLALWDPESLPPPRRAGTTGKPSRLSGFYMDARHQNSSLYVCMARAL